MALFKDIKKSLIISSSFTPKNLFCESSFTTYYTLRNKIIAIILADISAIKYGFIDEKFAEKIYHVLEIEL